MLQPPPLQGVPPLHTSRAGTDCQERCSHSSANDSDGPRSCPFQVKSEGSCGALQCRPGEPHTGRTRWGRLPSPRAPYTASPSRHLLDHWAGATDTPRSPRSSHCSASKPSPLCLVPWRLWEAISVAPGQSPLPFGSCNQEWMCLYRHRLSGPSPTLQQAEILFRHFLGRSLPPGDTEPTTLSAPEHRPRLQIHIQGNFSQRHPLTVPPLCIITTQRGFF